MSAAVDYDLLPKHLRDGVRRYVEEGIETGGFLRAVFENDLVKTFLHGDDESRRGLSALAMFLDIDAPPECWGSPEKVQAWIDAQGGRLPAAAGNDKPDDKSGAET